MKITFVAALVLAVALTTTYSQTTQLSGVRPKDGFVPNAETAVKIAEAVLVPVYGKNQIESERPFTATRQGDVWAVAGTLNCGAPPCVGGTAVVKISKVSGRILFMAHYK